MRIKRREFLKITGTATLSAGMLDLIGCSHPTYDDYKNKKLDISNKPSVCLQCPGGCGLLVKVVNGKAVKIDGLPGHPVNEGRVCPKGQAGLQVLYDPDRIKGPLKRDGKRGEGKFIQISWDQALDEISEKLRMLRNENEANSLVFLTGRVKGSMGTLIKRFMKYYGSPNYIGHSGICSYGAELAHYLTQGVKGYLAYDWWNTNYVLDFGGSILEAWRPTTMLLRAWGNMRARGVKITVVDVRGSTTSLKATNWIPVRPGMDGLLALGIAHEIVKNRLFDEDFIIRYTRGFNEFKEYLFANCSPEMIAEKVDVSPEIIKRIAKEFGEAKQRAIAAGSRGAITWTNGVFNYMAIHSLNALIGSIGRKGGVIVQDEPPLAKLYDPPLDAVAKKGLTNKRVDHAGTEKYPLARDVYTEVWNSIIEEKPYKTRALFMYYTDPFFSTPDSSQLKAAAQKLELIVGFSPFLSDGSVYCDYILPDDTFLERVQDDIVYPSTGFPVASIRTPVVQKLFDTRNTGDVLIDLAKRNGGVMERAFSKWENFESMLKDIYIGLWKSGRGNIVAKNYDDWWLNFKERGVWFDKPYRYFKEECEEKKWQRFHFRTKSERFEFKSGILEKIILDSSERSYFKKYYPLPHFEEPYYDGDRDDYPFNLITYKLITHAEGRGANIPNLQEILGDHVSRYWQTWVEINPKVAKKLGIKDREIVWIESRIGRIQAQAKLFEGVRHDCVNMPFELGHTEYGRWAKNRGANPNSIISLIHDHISGVASFNHMRVKIYKA